MYINKTIQNTANTSTHITHTYYLHGFCFDIPEDGLSTGRNM